MPNPTPLPKDAAKLANLSTMVPMSARRSRFFCLIQNLCDEFESLHCDLVQKNAASNGVKETIVAQEREDSRTSNCISLRINHDQKAARANSLEQAFGDRGPPSESTESHDRTVQSHVSPEKTWESKDSMPSNFTPIVEAAGEQLAYSSTMSLEQSANRRRSSARRSVFTEAAEEAKRQSASITMTSATIDMSSSAGLLDKLREQFDRLDPDGKDIIPLEKITQLVTTHTPAQVDPEALVDALQTMHSERWGEKDTKPTGRGSTNYITFGDFRYLMTTANALSIERTAVPLSSVKDYGTVKDVLRQAFVEFDSIQRKMALETERKLAKFKRTALFLDIVPAPVIVVNAMVMGIRPGVAPKHVLWDILDVCFLLFYIGEALIKGLLFGMRVYWCGPERIWNWFDVLCITVSLCDAFLTYIWPIIFGHKVSAVGELMLMKMLRLAKLARLVKVLRYPFFDELKAMIFGVVSGVRVLLWAIVLLFVIIFFFGVVLNNVISHEAEFETVPASMFTIFRCFTDGCSARDGTPLQERLRQKYGALFIFAYVGAFMLVTFGIFNLIMAIFIENVVSTSDYRKQHELGSTEQFMKTRFEEIFANLIIKKDIKGKRHHLLTPRQRTELERQWREDVEANFRLLPTDLEISRGVFNMWMKDDEFVKLLEEADVETGNTTDLFDALDADMSGHLTLMEVVNGLMKLRGPMTKCDMIATRMKIRYITSMIQELHEKAFPEADMTNSVTGQSNPRITTALTK